MATIDKWPKFAQDRLINLITLHHLHQRLLGLAKNVDFRSLDTVFNSFQNDVLQEIVEGLLSAFQEKLDAITLTNDDITQAFDKYGIHSTTGDSKHLGETDLIRDSMAAYNMQMPRYVNCIMKQEELEQAKQKVATYKKAQEQEKEKQVNSRLSKRLIGFIKQHWSSEPDRAVISEKLLLIS